MLVLDPVLLLPELEGWVAGIFLFTWSSSLFQILATTLGVLAEISPLIPTAMFASCALVSGVLSLFLPETHGAQLPDSPEESEKISLVKIRQLFSFKIETKTEEGK